MKLETIFFIKQSGKADLTQVLKFSSKLYHLIAGFLHSAFEAPKWSKSENFAQVSTVICNKKFRNRILSNVFFSSLDTPFLPHSQEDRCQKVQSTSFHYLIISSVVLNCSNNNDHVNYGFGLEKIYRPQTRKHTQL